MMITTADKLNMVVWAFSLFSVLILLLIAFSWYRKKRLSLFNKVAILLVLAGTASFVDAYWIEPNWLQTEHMQGGQISNLSPLERDLIAQVNALKPDLLFITGDFFSDKQTWELAAEVTALAELIRSFKTTTGIFGVPGNYDGPLSDPAIMKKFKAAGIDILVNENRAVALPHHKTLYLAGFDDSGNKRAHLKVFSGIPSGAPVVLLAHDPGNFGEAIGVG